MEREAWQATVHGVTKSWTWLSDWHFHFHTLLFGCVHFSVSHPKMWEISVLKTSGSGGCRGSQHMTGPWVQTWMVCVIRPSREPPLEGTGSPVGLEALEVFPQTRGQDSWKHLDSSLDFCLSPRQEDRESMLLLALISGSISLLWMSHWLSA